MQMIPISFTFFSKKKPSPFWGPKNYSRLMHHGVPCQVMTFKSKKWNFIGWWTLGSPLGSRRVRQLDPTLFFYERIKPIKLIHVIFFPCPKIQMWYLTHSGLKNILGSKLWVATSF